MSPSRIQIREQRARLVERAARQREQLAQDIGVFSAPIALADRGMAAARFLRAHPEILAAAAALLVLLKPRRAFGWIRRGLALWQTWRWVAARLA